MAVDQKSVQRIVNRIGPVKNQGMAFVLLATLIINLAAYPLSGSDDLWKQICGVAMHFIAILLPVGYLFFYIYAVFHLPSSQQEFLFAEQAKRTLARGRKHGLENESR